MQSDVQIISGKALLFGIKFKPGAFSCFHKYESLSQITNRFFEFTKKDFPDVQKNVTNLIAYIDQFYLDRFSATRTSLLPIVADIIKSQGSLKIEQITKKHFITERSLERQFKQHIGLTPKEFIDIERFNVACSKIQRREKNSIFDIAIECGYYDHAHLTNDFKRYTGKSPTDFVLSEISKDIPGNYQ